MRSEREILERLASTNDAFVIEVLRWVLDGDCPMCSHGKRREFELAIYKEEYGFMKMVMVQHGPKNIMSYKE